MFTFNRANFAAASLAKKNGCKPIWSEHYEAFCYSCDDGLHCGDQQCSVITIKSAGRKKK